MTEKVIAMRTKNITTLLLVSSMWLLMMTDYRYTYSGRNQDGDGIYSERKKGYVSTGLWYKTKQKCEAAAGKLGIKSGAKLCVKSTPTQ